MTQHVTVTPPVEPVPAPTGPERRKKPVRVSNDTQGAVTAAPGSPGQAPAPKRPSLVRMLLPLVVLGALGYGASAGYEWFVTGRYIISTDDAYVGADMAVISAKVSGHITNLAVTENQFVHTGDLLAQIDDGDYRLAVASARDKVNSQTATIARVDRQIEAQAAMIAQANAQLDGARAQLKGAEAEQLRAAQEFDRSQKLLQSSIGSQQRLEQAAAEKSRTVAAYTSAVSAERGAVAAVDSAKANLAVMQAQKAEAVAVRNELVTAEERAERDLSFTRIVAPFDGVVGNKAVELGQLAQPGTRLMALVSLSSAYIDANFKETQLDTIRPGQKVDVTVDSLGGRTIEGKVESIAPATGSQFSLLPPDNATGNFTKVVQRVPVRISLPADALHEATLRPGLSVVAAVHTRDESLPRPTILGALGFEASAAQRTLKP